MIKTDGIQMYTGKNIKGTLIFIGEDNLGGHSLGGLLENFSKAKYFCRYCLITRDEFYRKYGALNVYPERNKESDNKAIDFIKQNKDVVSFQGVKFNSVCNE